MDFQQRISGLRKKMEKAGIDAYILPSNDPHNSEYLPDHWKVREWISGFTGSAGTAVITKHHLGLWTDSRYFIQAVAELAQSGFSLHKLVNQGADEYVNWLAGKLGEGQAVGLDESLFSPNQIRSFGSILSRNGIALETKVDLMEGLWKGRPSIPAGEVYEADPQYTGETREKRLARVYRKVRESGAAYHLVSTLDDLAWILNLRGRDVEFNPVAIGYLMLGPDHHCLFMDAAKIPSAIRKRLEEDKVEVLPYDSIGRFINNLKPGSAVMIDPSTLNARLYNELEHCKLVKAQLPSRLMKAIKNKTEMAWLRKVMVKDGVALLRLFRWIEETLSQRGITEYELAQKIAHFRSLQGNYVGESFSAIVGFRGNGAIVHYRPEDGESATIRGEGILLMDSGGQYHEGTTDITRTIALREPTDEQRRNYTLVLKGHIALAKARFPKGTKGVQLDILARQFLWQEGLNYGHGTGHGVGFFLNVHEPPQGFVPGLNERGTTVFEPGMYTSNEPGFYKEDEYGIRIENLVISTPDRSTDFGEFMHFETITLFPIQQKLLDLSIMTESEIAWLNSYHRKVLKSLSPHLDEGERKWLEEQCRPVGG